MITGKKISADQVRTRRTSGPDASSHVRLATQSTVAPPPFDGSPRQPSSTSLSYSARPNQHAQCGGSADPSPICGEPICAFSSMRGSIPGGSDATPTAYIEWKFGSPLGSFEEAGSCLGFHLDSYAKSVITIAQGAVPHPRSDAASHSHDAFCIRATIRIGRSATVALLQHASCHDPDAPVRILHR